MLNKETSGSVNVNCDKLIAALKKESAASHSKLEKQIKELRTTVQILSAQVEAFQADSDDDCRPVPASKNKKKKAKVEHQEDSGSKLDLGDAMVLLSAIIKKEMAVQSSAEHMPIPNPTPVQLSAPQQPQYLMPYPNALHQAPLNPPYAYLPYR